MIIAIAIFLPIMLVGCAHTHSFGEWSVETAATCETEGIKVRKCPGCDEVETEVIVALGHKFALDEGKTPTCAEAGTTVGAHCSVCDKVLVEQQKLNKLDHNYGEWEVKTEASCTIDGKKVRACLDCKHEDTDIIPAIGHVYEKHDGVAATCTETGLTDGAYCSECGDILVERIVTQKIPHVPEIDEAVAPTLYTTGLTEGSHCSVCDTVIVERHVVPKLTEADLSYTVIFNCEGTSGVIIYNTQDYSDGYASNIAYSRNSDTGELDLSGDGQVNFTIVIPYAYKLKEVKVTPSSGFKNLKDPSETKQENTYRITKIKSDLTVTITLDIETSDFPAMVINTENNQAITSKEEYVGCSVSVINSEIMLGVVDYNFEDEGAKIRGRGNTTWGACKKPYKLKFNKAIDLFGNGVARTWTLLANYTDLSLIRNYLVYEIAQNSELLGHAVCTTTQFVDLFLNGEYCGVYLVCEQNEVNENRVEISDELITSDSELYYDTGYLLEIDGAYYSGDINVDYFVYKNQIYVVHSPDTSNKIWIDNSDAFIKKVKDKLDAVYSVLYSEKTSENYALLSELVNVNSFIDGYIVDELVKTADRDYSSFYIYFDNKDGKLYRGPLWDYDASIGNCAYAGGKYAKQLYAADTRLYSLLLEFDDFRDAVTDTLKQNETAIKNFISERVAEILSHENSFLRNFIKYDVFENYDNYLKHWNTEEIMSIKNWSGQVDFVFNWLMESLDFMVSCYITN